VTAPALPPQPPPPTTTPKQWPSLLALLAGTLAFLAIAADQLFHGQLFRWNDPIRLTLHTHSTPGGVLFFSALSALGEFAFLFPFVLAIGILLWWQHQKRATLVWAIALLGSVVLNESLKNLFQVPRPDRLTFYVFAPHTGYSFPSGHTMGVTITAGTLLLLATRLRWLTPKKIRLATLATILLSLAVAFALMYMGVHTLTDVLSALAVSLAWLGAIRWMITRWLPPIHDVNEPQMHTNDTNKFTNE
jgi:membrane-associated phospholipid phosphatase